MKVPRAPALAALGFALSLVLGGAARAQASPDPEAWEDMVRKSLGYAYGSLEETPDKPGAGPRDMPQVTFVLAEVKYGSQKPVDGGNRAGAHFRQKGSHTEVHHSIKMIELPREIVLGRPIAFKAELKRMARFTGGKLTEYSSFGRNEYVCAKTPKQGEFTHTAMGMRVNGRKPTFTEGGVALQPACDRLQAHKGALDLEETVSIGAVLTPVEWRATDSESSGRTKVTYRYKVDHSLSGTPRTRGRQENPIDIAQIYFKLDKGKAQDFTRLVPERIPDSVFLAGGNRFQVTVGARDFPFGKVVLFTNMVTFVYEPKSVRRTPVALQPYEHPSLEAAVASAETGSAGQGKTPGSGSGAGGRASGSAAAGGAGTAGSGRGGAAGAGGTGGTAGGTAGGGSGGAGGAIGMAALPGAGRSVIPGIRGSGPGGRVTPADIDPGHPRIAPLIETWITQAEPPQNATEGAKLRYSKRGVLVGRAANGGIIRAPHETGAFDPRYLWARPDKRRLDSINHCTLEEYVLARVEGRATGHCRGRYRTARRGGEVAVLRMTGRPAREAKQRLERAGFKVRLKSAGAPPGKAQEFTVASQVPEGGRAARGSTVTIGVYSKYVALLTMPRLTGLGWREAERRARAAGLTPRRQTGGAAPKRSDADAVAAQVPSAGATVRKGSEVLLTVYGPHRAAPRGPSPAERARLCDTVYRDLERSAWEARQAAMRRAESEAVRLGCDPRRLASARASGEAARRRDAERAHRQRARQCEPLYRDIFDKARAGRIREARAAEAAGVGMGCDRSQMVTALTRGESAHRADEARRRQETARRCRPVYDQIYNLARAGRSRDLGAGQARARALGCDAATVSRAVARGTTAFRADQARRRQETARRCRPVYDQLYNLARAGRSRDLGAGQARARALGCDAATVSRAVARGTTAFRADEARRRQQTAGRCRPVYDELYKLARAGRSRDARAREAGARRLGCDARIMAQAIAKGDADWRAAQARKPPPAASSCATQIRRDSSGRPVGCQCERHYYSSKQGKCVFVPGGVILGDTPNVPTGPVGCGIYGLGC